MNVEFIFKDLNRIGGLHKNHNALHQNIKPSFENIKPLKIDPKKKTMLYKNIPSKYNRKFLVDFYNSCQNLDSMVTMHRMQRPKRQSMYIYIYIYIYNNTKGLGFRESTKSINYKNYS